MQSMTLEKIMKNSRKIGQIRLRLPGIFKHRIALLMHKKLIKNLAKKLKSAGIQNVLHFEFSGVISLRAEGSIHSIHNTKSRLNPTYIKYIMNGPAIR